MRLHVVNSNKEQNKTMALSFLKRIMGEMYIFYPAKISDIRIYGNGM